MNSVFEWTRRRRRLSGFNCKTNNAIKATEYVSFGCCCNDQKIPDRQPVSEIVLTDELICILRDDGIGKALDKSTHKEICRLNASPHCLIRSINYNPLNNTIIVVWHSLIFNCGLSLSIHCPKRIKQGDMEPLASALEFQSLLIPYPGFIEFEEQNGRIITSTQDDRRFTFWSMKDYSYIFSVNNELYKEIRISRGTVALFNVELVRDPCENRLYVKLCNIINGETLSDLELYLAPNRALKFLELCGCYLLVKQDGACLRVHDLVDGVDEKIAGTRDFCPKADDPQENLKPTKGPTKFLAVHEWVLEVCVCTEGRLMTLMTINSEIPQDVSNYLQVVQQEQILLVYTKNPDAYFDLREPRHSTLKCQHSLPGSRLSDCKSTAITADYPRREEFAIASMNSTQKTLSIGNKFHFPFSMIGNSSSYPFSLIHASSLIAPSKVSLMELKHRRKRNGCAGVTIIDLQSGRRIGFVPLTCDYEVYVLAFDVVRREILAGGARGLHRMHSKFDTTNEVLQHKDALDLLRLFHNPLQAQCVTRRYLPLISRPELLSTSSIPSDFHVYGRDSSPSNFNSLLRMVRRKSHRQSCGKRRLNDSPETVRRYPKRRRMPIKRFVIQH